MTGCANAAPAPKKLNAARRKIFLAHLAETSNVAASARLAGISSAAIYAERRRSEAFRRDWSDALAEGYARLEADMLAEALQAPCANISDAMLKARAQKHRLRLNLLNAHRVSVKGLALVQTKQMPGAGKSADDADIKAQMLAKLDGMRRRAGASINITNKDNLDADSGAP